MATGDQSDILGRLRAVLPGRWFSSTTPGLLSSTPVLDGLLTGPSWTVSWLYNLLQYIMLQRRIATATDINLDLIGFDYFGLKLPRVSGESDTAYRARLKANLLAPKNTRASIISAVELLTGFAPTVFEPRNASDTGGYGFQGMTAGTGLGYGVAGGYGSLLLPFQAFVTAFRPHGGGVSNTEGYYALGSGIPAIGGYGQGQLQYISTDMIQGVITDDDILATIADTAPEATILWARVANNDGTPEPVSVAGARLATLAAEQVVRANAFIGLPGGTLTERQASQLISALASTGNTFARANIAEASQVLSAAASFLGAAWNQLDLAGGMTLSDSNLTASTPTSLPDPFASPFSTAFGAGTSNPYSSGFSSGFGSSSAASIQAGVRSTIPRQTGKWYAEISVGSGKSGERFGLATPTWSETATSGLGGDPNSLSIGTGGAVRQNDVILATESGVSGGGVLSIAADLDTRLVWFRVNNGPWGTSVTSSVTGTASAGTAGSGPVISGPASGTVSTGSVLAMSGCTISDTIWPHAGTATLNVTCTSGTVAMTLNGAQVAGSGTNSISLNDTSDNLQGALATLTFTAPSKAGSASVSVQVFDQFGQNSTRTIPITIAANADPTVGVETGGISLGSMSGAIMVAFGTNQSGSRATVNLGGSAFAFPVPSGYQPWNGVQAAVVAPTAPSAVTPASETTNSITLTWNPSS